MATCPDDGAHHARSIASTNEIIQQAIETLCSLLANPMVDSVFDFSKHRGDILTLLIVMNLTGKQCLFYDLFLSFAKKDEEGVITGLVGSMIQFLRKEGHKYHFQKTLKRDIMHLLDCNFLILRSKKETKSKAPEMEAKLAKSIAAAAAIGEEIISDILDDLEKQKKECGYQTKFSQIWQKAFQIVLQLESLRPDAQTPGSPSLVRRIHEVFFNLDQGHQLEHLQGESQGLQLLLVPTFLAQVKAEMIGS
jgi:hypothetical protein